MAKSVLLNHYNPVCGNNGHYQSSHFYFGILNNYYLINVNVVGDKYACGLSRMKAQIHSFTLKKGVHAEIWTPQIYSARTHILLYYIDN